MVHFSSQVKWAIRIPTWIALVRQPLLFSGLDWGLDSDLKPWFLWLGFPLVRLLVVWMGTGFGCEALVLVGCV